MPGSRSRRAATTAGCVLALAAALWAPWGAFMLEAADGDTIVGTHEGEVSDIDVVVGVYEHVAVVTGGTGRFAGASGLLRVQGKADLTDPASTTYTQDLSGAISSPGQARR